MKFSENWLRTLVPIAWNREELVSRLTMAGLEVESLQAIGADLDAIVCARILEAAPHPGADRLRVCSVDAGGDAPVTIVCGAPNARDGLMAALAPPGSRLPDGRTIEAASLRGVESMGMLCSAQELGIDQDARGLIELPDSAKPGAPVATVLELPDAIIELKLTPNRSDCLGMEGLAAEVAALASLRWTAPPAAPVAATLGANDRSVARLDAGAACPRYLGRVVEGVDMHAESPGWMRRRLIRSGLRPVNAVVDISNYVLLETGQPTHAFDLTAVGEGLAVRWAVAGESLHLLDGRTVKLDAESLVVADARGPLALAGVMGGFDSRVTDSTTALLLEAAHFAPAAIAGRTRRFGLNSDAAHRFERGVDPELPRRAMERVTALVLEVCGGRAGPVSESCLDELLPAAATIRLRQSRVSRVLGIDPGREHIQAILQSLGMRVDPDAEGWMVRVPSRRFDLAIEEDLIEEVARVVGYDTIPARVPEGAISAPELASGRVDTALAADALRHRGYVEAINFSFLDAMLLKHWKLDAAGVRLANPLATDLAVMRTALLPGLVQALERNSTRQLARLRLFECGRVFHASADGGAPVETPRIAGCAMGSASREHWEGKSEPMDFFDLKGDVQQLMALSGAASSDFDFAPRDDTPAWLHPGQSAALTRDGRVLGWLGAMSPHLRAALDLDFSVWMFEFELDALLRRGLPQAGAISRFPSVRRDLAIIVPEGIPFARIEACVREAIGPLLQEVILFDRFVGPELPPGCKSVAIGLILQDPSRTLEDQDATGAVAAAVSALECGLRARLRG